MINRKAAAGPVLWGSTHFSRRAWALSSCELQSPSLSQGHLQELQKFQIIDDLLHGSDINTKTP